MIRATKRRIKRRKHKDTLLGKDSWHVLDPAGVEIKVTGLGPNIGLILAQERAVRDFTEPVELTVEQRSLFGPATPIYRVSRDEHGVVRSFVLAQID
jgi:hypothetical protein